MCVFVCVCGGEVEARQMYLIVSSVLHLMPVCVCVCLCLCVCAHVCVCVCELHKRCYESVIRVVTHLSNAPIPLGCHTL